MELRPRQSQAGEDRTCSCRGRCAFEPDAITQQCIDVVATRFADHIGDLAPFWFAVTRADAERAVDHFIDDGARRVRRLSGRDAGRRAVPLSFAAVSLHQRRPARSARRCRRVEAAYRAGPVPLNAAEGYIRQIIGWREYVRGIYWLKMPGYVAAEFLRPHAAGAGVLLDGRDGHGVHPPAMARPNTKPMRTTSSA